MWLGFLRGQLDGRYFPISDHHIRGLSIIGEAGRCLHLFQQLYNRNPSEFQLGSVSSMLFMALGCEQLPQAFISTLSSHFQQLSAQTFSSHGCQPLRHRQRPNLYWCRRDPCW